MMNKFTYTDSTLKYMTKKELIEYIKCLEHNLQAMEEMNINQYKLLRRMTEKGLGDYYSNN